jgi:hypothetical protein
VDYTVAVLVGLGLAELATMITTIYLHRVLSHKSIELHPAMTFFMRIGTWILTSNSPREWMAVHRKHHNFTDVAGIRTALTSRGIGRSWSPTSTTTGGRQTTTAPCRSMPPTFPTTVSTGCSGSSSEGTGDICGRRKVR